MGKLKSIHKDSPEHQRASHKPTLKRLTLYSRRILQHLGYTVLG